MPSSFNPWIAIWTKPRQTIKTIIETNPNFRLFWLMFFYGFNILFSFSLASVPVFSKTPQNPYFLLVFSLLFAPLAGYFFLSAFAWFVYFVGKWFKGNAPYKHVRAAIAWSTLPAVVNSFLFYIFLLTSGQSLDMQSMMNLSMPIWLSVIQFTLSIWGLIIFLLNISEVQKFSKLRAFFNIFVGSVVFAFTIGLVSMLIGTLIGGFNLNFNLPQTTKTFPGAV